MIKQRIYAPVIKKWISFSDGLCVVLIVSLFALSGCSSVKYYSQAVYGQLELLAKRKSVAGLLRSADLDSELRQRLELSQELLKFANQQLFLPVGKSYSAYTDLKRPYVVWNVFATPELSMTPKLWCYPIVGCASYRGFFNQNDASQFQKQLKARGYDVYSGGVRAYSTLGWFDDPLLNTFIYDNDIELARLLFHELAHKKYYVSGDTDFNESYATVVELEGVKAWLKSKNKEVNLTENAVVPATVDLILATRSKLNDLYQKELSDHQKRQEKQRLIDQLRGSYKAITNGLADPQPFDHWMASPINNAKINSISSYRRWVPALTHLFRQSSGWDDFYHRIEWLMKMTPDQREQALLLLLAKP